MCIVQSTLMGTNLIMCNTADVELNPANIFGVIGVSPTNIVRLFELSPFSLISVTQEIPRGGWLCSLPKMCTITFIVF